MISCRILQESCKVCSKILQKILASLARLWSNCFLQASCTVIEDSHKKIFLIFPSTGHGALNRTDESCWRDVLAHQVEKICKWLSKGTSVLIIQDIQFPDWFKECWSWWCFKANGEIIWYKTRRDFKGKISYFYYLKACVDMESLKWG